MSVFGTPMPWVAEQFTDDNGNPLVGGLLSTFIAGTTTPATTYSDVNLSIANANPIVLDSAGRATVYLPIASFKFVMKNAAGVTQWTRDNVPSIGYVQAINTAENIVKARLTLVSGRPIPTTDVTDVFNVYLTPYQGDLIGLWDSTITAWVPRTFTEITVSTVASALTTGNYDVFAYWSGTSVLTEIVKWTNTSTRATVLGLQNNVEIKSGDATRRYMGTFQIVLQGSDQAAIDALNFRCVYNRYNQVWLPFAKYSIDGAYNYTTATWRQQAANIANQVFFVQGLNENPVYATVVGVAANTNPTLLGIAIGVDSTSTPSGDGRSFYAQVANIPANARAEYQGFLAAGTHFLAALEFSTAVGTTTWNPSATEPTVGITGRILM